MSYINPGTLRLQPRRHRIKRLTPEEAIAEANKVVDKANDRIAEAMAYAGQYEQVARTYEEENRELRARIAELEKVAEAQEAEIGRLKRKVERKAGKRKGEEWIEDE